jgi:HEAT repeats/NACHT domain
MNFIRNFDLDRNSFLIGFVLGVLFWWFVGVLRPMLRRAAAILSVQLDQARAGASRGLDVRLANDILQRVQRMHVASALFSLDEIRIEPSVLAPPQFHTNHGEELALPDITGVAIPYTPDVSEIAGIYQAKSFSLAEALSGGANIILTGKSGSGRSFALADLASQIARRDPAAGDLNNLATIYLHAMDFNPEASPDQTPIKTIVEAVVQHTSLRTGRQLPRYLENAFAIGRVLILLDGMDDLPPGPFDTYVEFIRRLFSDYPSIRMVVAASTSYIGDLPTLGLVPLQISAWDEPQRTTFIRQWSRLWTRYINSEVWSDDETGGTQGTNPIHTDVDPLFVEGMLENDQTTYYPVELTLHVWAAFAGDMLGSDPADSINAHIRRTLRDISGGVDAAEQLAANMLSQQTAALRRNEVDGGSTDLGAESGEGELTDELILTTDDSSEKILVRRVLSRLISSGLIRTWNNGQITFQHSRIFGYMAASGLARIGGAEVILSEPKWETNVMTLEYLARMVDVTPLATRFLELRPDPLRIEFFRLADAMRGVPKGQSWRTNILRKLAQIIQSNNSPFLLRIRAVNALATCGDPDVPRLFRHLLDSGESLTRQLAALGAGYVRDTEAIPTLSQRLYDSGPGVQKAACLALVNIGSDEGLEQVAAALLNGDDELRRAAAEAFANNPEEGYPLLKDGAALDDLLVRRAVVFGLARVQEPWSLELLEHMQMEDEQWVVRAAATQAVEERTRPYPSIPKPDQALHELPWLIAFASERGMGVTTGKPAQDMLKLALKEGSMDEKIAALHYLQQALDNEAIDQAYSLFFNDDLEIQVAAYQALWALAAGGFDLPAPRMN